MVVLAAEVSRWNHFRSHDGTQAWGTAREIGVDPARHVSNSVVWILENVRNMAFGVKSSPNCKTWREPENPIKFR
jgi:hypothetical protein